MNKADLEGLLAMSRRKTMELVEALAAPAGVLGWRPGAGRVALGWQLMHIAATEDRHLRVRMFGGEPAEGEWVRRCASGSVPGGGGAGGGGDSGVFGGDAGGVGGGTFGEAAGGGAVCVWGVVSGVGAA